MFDPKGPTNRREFLAGLGGIALTGLSIAGVATAPDGSLDFRPARTPEMLELDRLKSIAQKTQGTTPISKAWFNDEATQYAGTFSTPTALHEIDRLRQSKSMPIALHMSQTPSRWANDFERKNGIHCFSMHPSGVPGNAEPALRDRFFVSSSRHPRFPNESFDIIFVSDVAWGRNVDNEAAIHSQLAEISAMLKPQGVAIFSLRASETLAAIPSGFDHLRSSANSAQIAIRDHLQKGDSWEVGETYSLDHQRARERMRYYKDEGNLVYHNGIDGDELMFKTNDGFLPPVRDEEISLRKVTVLLRRDR